MLCAGSVLPPTKGGARPRKNFLHAASSAGGPLQDPRLKSANPAIQAPLRTRVFSTQPHWPAIPPSSLLSAAFRPKTPTISAYRVLTSFRRVFVPTSSAIPAKPCFFPRKRDSGRGTGWGKGAETEEGPGEEDRRTGDCKMPLRALRDEGVLPSRPGRPRPSVGDVPGAEPARPEGKSLCNDRPGGYRVL